MISRSLSTCLILLVACALMPALEIIGEPPAYLATSVTPTWRLVPLSTVLDELAKTAGVPIARTAAAKTQQPVLLSAIQAMTVKDALTLLEHCAPIRFSVAAEILTVDDVIAFDQRKTETRWYPLIDYGLFDPQRDFPLAQLGLKASQPLGGLQAPNPQAFGVGASNPEEIVEYLQQHIAPESWQREGVGIEQRGGAILFISNTPEVHAAIHATFTAMHAFANRSKRWQVTFGVLPKDGRLPTGIVTSAQAKSVTGRLTTPDVLTLAGLLGQQVHAQTGGERSQIVAVDIVNYHLDARPEAVTRGRSVVLRAMDGHQVCLINTRLNWVEDSEPAALSEIRAPAHTTIGSTSTTVKTGETTKDGKAGATELTTSTALPQTEYGERVRLDLPVLWTWRPEFECLLPHGRALILSTEHPRGQAVMVLEELP